VIGGKSTRDKCFATLLDFKGKGRGYYV
jgi:hypothetical protein